jgi:hypothetical protein
VARREFERNVKVSSENSVGIAYKARTVGLKCAVMDLHLGTIFSINSSALEVAVVRREFERKFEIVLLAENARMELKRSAKESRKANLPFPV